MRTASVTRNTSETQIGVSLNLDGAGSAKLATGLPFLDHMLDQVARHGMIDLEIAAKGDLHIDAHHTVEDVGISLGRAVADALGDKRGIRRLIVASQSTSSALRAGPNAGPLAGTAAPPGWGALPGLQPRE